MENEQTELAPAALEGVPATPEITQVSTDASIVQPEPKKEYISAEPRHPLQDVLDKAAAKKQAEESAKQPKQEPTLGQKPVEPFELSKWNGDVQALPEQLKKIITDNQTAFHAKAKEAADTKAQFDDLQNKVNNYLKQVEQQNAAKQPLFSREEFEAAQLDPNKFLELTTRVAQNIVDREKQNLEPIISQVQFNQQVVENERVINDFATKNKDFWQLYDAGILEPLVSKHGLQEGYRMAAQAKSNLLQEATNTAQARVQEKKSSVSVKPTSTQSIEVTYVDRPEDVLPTAMRYAAEGKHIKVKLRPK